MKKFAILLLMFLFTVSLGIVSACASDSSEHTHIYSEDWSYDQTYHWHAAECAHMSETKDKASHTFDDGEVIEPTYDIDGVIVYTCTECGYQIEGAGEPKLEHHYSDTLTHNNGETHWYPCIDPGFENLKKDEIQHTYGSGVVTDPTYENDGFITYTCACGHVKIETGELKLEHNYSHMLTHSNGETHWYPCTDAGYETLKKGESRHSYGSGVVTAPTYENDGFITYTCACGYVKVDAGEPKLEHNYSDTLTHNNGETHWYPCTDVGFETLKKGESQHSYGSGVVTDPTYENDGFITYTCVCGHVKVDAGEPKLEHNYSDTLTHNNGETHWYPCIDVGFETLRKGEEVHNLIETNYNVSTGYATYTCACGYTINSLRSEIITLPTVQNSRVYVGQRLSDVILTGGEGSVEGTFAWVNPEMVIAGSGEYRIVFYPTDSEYAVVSGIINIVATQLTVTVDVGANGSASTTGTVDVNYGDDFIVTFTPDEEYIIDELIIDGVSVEVTDCYTFSDIVETHTVSVNFIKINIESLPTISNSIVYIGQKLSDVILTGGEGSVDGTFGWANPDTVITYNGEYKVIFTPTNTDYHTVDGNITINAIQLTVTVSVGANGSVSTAGTVNVNYGSDFTITFTPDSGYVIDKIVVDGNDVGSTGLYTFDNISRSHMVSVSFICISIESLPTITNSFVYIGQRLSDVILTGGAGSVDGTFAWANPSTLITSSGEYNVVFTPTDSKYPTVECNISITATQLAVIVSVGENGSASSNGTVNVNYGDDFTITFTPDSGYEIDTLIVDGQTVNIIDTYLIENITLTHTISVTFCEMGSKEQLPFTLTYQSGTTNAYTFEDNVLTFTTITEKTVYSISGEFEGSIVIDVGDDYKFDLELTGFTLTSSSINPITVLSGDEVSLTAKKDTINYVYDKRSAIDSTDTTLYSAAIYSLVDLEVCGKGSLTVESDNNNGIHTKDDLQVKNLTLSVTCVDNALKGNDSVEIVSATTTLISKGGDCIKSTNSSINANTLKQKGTISITGGTHNLYAACDGIDAAYNVVVDDATTVLNVYTDKYSPYSGDVTEGTTQAGTYYLRYSNTNYKYSVKYYNSDSDYMWVNVSTSYITGSGNRPGSTYYYYSFAKNTNYSKLRVYMYSSAQTQGQDTSYYACSDYQTINSSYDTVSVSYSAGSLTVSWTNYSSSSGGQMGGGGMQEGNSDKGTYSTKGIKAENEIIINEGIIYVKSYDDAIHASNYNSNTTDGTLENGVAPTGNITINGGTITLYSNDDGVHADGTLTVVAGTISVTNSYEGIEGTFIDIQGGSVSVISSDDGFNATSTTGNAITIKGGTVYVYATGDGIDSNSRESNGGIVFSGGNTVVICNSNGNSAIDTESGYAHRGGSLLAIMSTGGMTSETSNASTSGTTKTVKSSLSLSNGGYLTVSVSSSTVATVKMPCAMTSYIVFIGSGSATISSATSSSATLDSNGVCWNS